MFCYPSKLRSESIPIIFDDKILKMTDIGDKLNKKKRNTFRRKEIEAEGERERK